MDIEPLISMPLKYSDGYVYIPLELELSKETTFRDFTFYAKAEFHCSLICVKCMMAELMEKHGREGGPLKRQILGEIETARQQSEPVFVGFRDELRYVAKDDNQSIIVMVDIGKLEPIFERLRTKYPIDIPSQPTHVTLYSAIPNKGIGIPSHQVLETTSELIKGAELKQLIADIEFEKLRQL
jgi:hypothetical protein